MCNIYISFVVCHFYSTYCFKLIAAVCSTYCPSMLWVSIVTATPTSHLHLDLMSWKEKWTPLHKNYSISNYQSPDHVIHLLTASNSGIYRISLHFASWSLGKYQRMTDEHIQTRALWFQTRVVRFETMLLMDILHTAKTFGTAWRGMRGKKASCHPEGRDKNVTKIPRAWKVTNKRSRQLMWKSRMWRRNRKMWRRYWKYFGYGKSVIRLDTQSRHGASMVKSSKKKTVHCMIWNH